MVDISSQQSLKCNNKNNLSIDNINNENNTKDKTLIILSNIINNRYEN